MPVVVRPQARPARAAVVALALALSAATPASLAQNNPANALVEEGLFVDVPSPITSEAVVRVKNRVSAARNQPNPVRKVVFDFNPGGKDASAADFGPAADLADFISSLHEMTTVGFVHARTTGHTVLPALACKELVIGRGAAIGEVTGPADQPLADYKVQAYRQAVGTTRAGLWAAVQKMYDRGVVLAKGARNGADWYVDLRKKDDAVKEGVVGIDPVPLPFAPAGQTALYQADAARSIGLARATADTAKELAEIYGISPASTRDPLGGRQPLAFHYTVRGPVDSGMRESVNRIARDVARQRGNVLFLELDCGGGDPVVARALADDLSEYQRKVGDDAVLIVAYVPDRAPDTATFVALGCAEIVMSRRKDAAKDANAGEDPAEAEIGDFETLLGRPNRRGGPPADPDMLRKSLEDLAEKQGYPALLARGMVDRAVEVVRVRAKADATRRRLMTREEFDADRGNWVDEGTIKPAGQLLKLSASRAAELGVARHAVDTRDLNSVYALYGVEAGRVREATPSWLDRFATFLRQPGVTVLLVVIGFTGLILEMKVPGLTVPGIVAALCFIMVFWAQSRFSGETFVLAVMLFMLGLALVALEIFVLPGFGAPGLFGILCMLAGLGLATMEQVPTTSDEWGQLGGRVGQYMAAMCAAMFLSFLLIRLLPTILPNVPMMNRMMLAPPGDTPDGDGAAFPGAGETAALLGAVGTAATVLRPAGVAQFGEQFVDVVTDGGYVPAGGRVQVVEIEGNRVVVKEV